MAGGKFKCSASSRDQSVAPPAGSMQGGKDGSVSTSDLTIRLVRPHMRSSLTETQPRRPAARRSSVLPSASEGRVECFFVISARNSSFPAKEGIRGWRPSLVQNARLSYTKRPRGWRFKPSTGWADLRGPEWGAKGELEWCPTIAAAMPDEVFWPRRSHRDHVIQIAGRAQAEMTGSFEKGSGT